MFRKIFLTSVFASSLFFHGCISRTQYLRDRLQDLIDKQRQAGFNAEVLRKLDERKEPCANVITTNPPTVEPCKERPNWPCFRCGEEKTK